MNAAKRPRGWLFVSILVVAAVAVIGVASSGAAQRHRADRTAHAAASGADNPTYVKYTGGTAGAANPKLAPVDIGYVNDQGGSTVIAGSDPTTAAQMAVTWLNKYADGIDGHPVRLVTCFVENTEAEGLPCAEKFLADKQVDVIAYGAMALGATTIDATVKGQKPIVEGVAINPPDNSTKHDYILFAAVPYIDYPWGTFAKQVLHAKTAAILYPNQTGQLEVEQALLQSLKAEGIKYKLVGFDPSSTDVTGALEAAGATSAGFVQSNVATPSECLAFAKSTAELGISPAKILGLFQCQIPSIKSQYPGGDYPKWYYGVANNGVQYEDNAQGKAYDALFSAMGQSSIAFDPWSLVDFAQVLTIAKWMNAIGYAKLSPATIEAQAHAFKGPLLWGPPELACGKYPAAPGVCADGNAFFRYEGNGSFKLVAPWLETPPALQKALHAKYITQ